MVAKRPKIGAQVSTAGGLPNCIANAEAIGAEAIQIFGSSPRQWSVSFPSADEIKTYKRNLAKSAVKEVYLHAPYLVNLSSVDEVMVQKSIYSLSGHLKIAEMIGADGLIFHVGSGGDKISKAVAIKQAAGAMKEVLKRSAGKAELIIENTAGGGQKIGATPEEIKELMDLVGSKRVKVCFDTAHAFEAGMIDKYDQARVKKLFDEWDKIIGLENIVALHINDSKTVFNSHNDRHENIGEGFIGLAGFKALAKEQRLYDKAWLLEVPGFNDEGPDAKNIKILKSCFK